MATPLEKLVYAINFSFAIVPRRLIMDRIQQSRDIAKAILISMTSWLLQRLQRSYWHKVSIFESWIWGILPV